MRRALIAVFGAVIIGAMLPSYLHLSAWLAPWMPPGWQSASYVAALSIDGLIMAPIMARQIVGAPVPGMALPLAQLLGIVASVYVNARWGAANVAGATLADVAVGAAILPVFALVAEHAMRATLAALQAPAAPVVRQRRAMVRASAPAAAPARKPGASRASWAELVARHGPDPRAISDATGTPLRTVQRWRQQAAG